VIGYANVHVIMLCMLISLFMCIFMFRRLISLCLRVCVYFHLYVNWKVPLYIFVYFYVYAYNYVYVFVLVYAWLGVMIAVSVYVWAIVRVRLWMFMQSVCLYVHVCISTARVRGCGLLGLCVCALGCMCRCMFTCTCGPMFMCTCLCLFMRMGILFDRYVMFVGVFIYV